MSSKMSREWNCDGENCHVFSYSLNLPSDWKIEEGKHHCPKCIKADYDKFEPIYCTACSSAFKENEDSYTEVVHKDNGDIGWVCYCNGCGWAGFVLPDATNVWFSDDY